MKISEFSKLTGISRDNLIFYDKQRILSPISRYSSNGYRNYSKKQLKHAYMVSILRNMDIPIADIKKYFLEQSSNELIKLLEQKKKQISDIMEALKIVSDGIDLYVENIESIEHTEIGVPYLKKLPAQPLFVGPELKETQKTDFEKENLDFYRYATQHGVDLIFPFGVRLSRQQIRNKNFTSPLQCFFFNSSKFK